ncbi:MAG: chemotaxis protein CheW [Betaproteobacteria bacterium]|nr:chemotaxis protein CheW [Betaproteobacteria bacterium]
MAFDMSQFYQVFFEEAAEHLATMESLLLDIDQQQPDSEDLNAIFRAAHSIKGSSGTFGFQDLAEVTHVLETLLDRIRKGEMALTEPMVDAFLVAGDVLKGLLGAHRGEGDAEPGAKEDICRRLRALSSSDQPQPAPPAARVDAASPPAPKAADAAPGQPDEDLLRTLVVRFVPEPRAAASDPIMGRLVDELVRQCRAVDVLRPPAGDLSAPWRLTLTGADPAVVDSTLEFVALPGSIEITFGGVADDASPPTEEAYGFFEPLDLAQLAEAADGDGYGFFEPLPQDAAAPAVQVADPGYGFFSDPPAATRPAAETPSDPGYGFFTEPASAPACGPAEGQKSAGAEPAAKPSEPPLQAVAQKSPPRENRTAKAAADTGSIRVSVEKVDQMINLVGELVITQAMLAQTASTVDPAIYERLMNGLSQLERNTRDLQESVMSIRMLPMSVVFSRFPRVVRDISQKLGKQVELKLSGESTELDKGLIERITDPLTHLVRNSLDHGIETPEARAAAGKPAVGTITLKASHQSGNIVIEVGDDGAGLNRARILAKARERGLAVSDAMSDQDVWQLIFEAGFSTADQVTEVSGRGVGMDVVKRNIGAMGGRIDIESMQGVGTRMTVRLPLTLAILDGMSVAVAAEHYIIPLNYVVESLKPGRDMMKSINGVQRLIQVRGEYLPVVALHQLFNIRGHAGDFERGIMVVLEADGHKAALFVDSLVGQHQVVIKNLEANYRKVAGIAGATIMGDGRVALILDASALVAMARGAVAVAA